MHYGRFKTKVRRHDRLFAGSAGCSEILKARAPRVLPGAPSGIGLKKMPSTTTGGWWSFFRRGIEANLLGTINRKALKNTLAELRSCVKVEVAVLGSRP